VEVKRGEIFFADLGENIGSEQNGTRPVVIVQNNIGNRFAPTVIVAAMTSRLNKTEIPTHVKFGESLILCEQIKTIDKSRLKNRIGVLTFSDMEKLNRAMRVSLEL
jgi:mRNA interferase MazF